MITSWTTHLPVFVVILPLFVGFILPTLARRLRLVENLVIAVEVVSFVMAAALAVLLFKQNGSPIPYAMGGWPAPWGIRIIADNLGVLFLLVIAIVGLPIALYTKGNLREEVGGRSRTARFYALYLLLMGALAGMAVTNDLFNVFVLVEVATLSACGLVSAHRNPRAAEAAFNYLILATLGSGLVMGSIGFLYITTGHLNMEFAARELAQVWQHSPHVVWMAASFMLTGFGVKAAMFPLHVWLPDAHSMAPTPGSAVLSGLAVKGYLICLLKILYNVFGQTLMRHFTMHHVLTAAGIAAILAGSILALRQDELKRRLAYSTVAQVGYIILGFGFVNQRGLAGSLFYLASHALIKSTLFLTAGAIISATGKTKVSELAGVGRKMPLTMGAFTVASLGLVGIPLFSGFVGKWHLLLGSFESGNFAAAAVILAGSVFCAAYLFPILRNAYFQEAPGENWQDPGMAQRAAFVLLSAAIIFFGILPTPLLTLAQRAAADLLFLQ